MCRVSRVALIGISAVLLGAGQQERAAPPLGASAPDCRNCHACEEPTPEVPCLLPCSRGTLGTGTGPLPALGPDIVILDELEDLYLPVPFDHRGHAEMAQMTRGCAVCHHYTPVGTAHPDCKTCHEVSPAREDMRKPSLKGAYHRQCMSCHREWSHATACEVCHPPKMGRDQGPQEASLPTPGDIVGRMHPPIPEPDTEVYQTSHLAQPGTRVLFRHKEHIHRYGLKCVDCHREDNCNRCHEEGKKHTQRARTFEDHHQPCLDCHKDQACERCHYQEEKGQPPPFEHSATGWPLARYHRNQSCRACHQAVPFVKLDQDCQSCHSAFSPETFDHSLTGQGLNETHAVFDCDDCHPDGYVAPPSCTECHDAEEGITFPAKRPGERVSDAVGRK